MPFASLRRKTVGDRPNSKGHEQPPSPARSRSNTTPTLTPRKSFSSLIETHVRGRAASASPVISPPDAIEQDLAPRHYPDPSTPNPVSETADQASLQEQFPPLKRSPSPHPLKWRGTPPSRRSRIDRANLSRSHSDTSLQEAASSKGFLETLADAIKAPTSLFYRDTRSTKTAKKTEKTPDSSGDQSAPLSVPTEHHKTSPKKSVRFRPGTSIINDVEKSSPINIPRAFPTLPPVQLATTPLLQCFGKTSLDQVPTARPPQTQALNSSAEFRQAIIEAQSAIPFLDLDQGPNLVHPQTNLPTPLPGTNLSMDDPFAHAMDEPSPEAKQTLLANYEHHFPNKTPLPCASTDLRVDTPSASRTIGGQSPTSSHDFIPVRSSEDPSHSPLPSTSSLQAQYQVTSFGDLREPAMATSPPFRPRDPSSLPIGQDLSKSGKKKLRLAKSNFSQPHPSVSSNFDGVMHPDVSKYHSAGYQTEMAPAITNPDNAAVSKKWNKTPTHEDIRQQFKVPRLGKLIKELGSFEREGMSKLAKDAAVTPRSEPYQTFDTLSFDKATREKEILASHADEEEHSKGPPSLSPHISLPALLEALHSPWTAELVLRSDKPTHSKTSEDALREHTPPEMYQLHNRGLNNTDEALESLSITSLPSTEHAREIAEQVNYSADDTENMSTPVPSTRILSLSSMSSEHSGTTSPSCIPLPMSARRQDRTSRYRDQDGWSPLDDPHFTYAAMAACETDEAGMRSLLSLQGGLHAFWQESQLPQSTSPAHDTRGLANAEIDGLVASVKESRSWQEPIATQFVEAYKIKFSNHLPDSTSHSHEYEDMVKVNRQHSHPGITGSKQYTHCSEGNLSINPKQYSLQASSVAQERAGGLIPSDEHKYDTNGFTTIDTISLGPAACIDPVGISPDHGHCVAGVGTEAEEGAQGKGGDQNNTPRPRRETMQSHHSQGTGRRNSTWSAGSGRSSRTSVDSTAKGMAEDENFCRGIV